MIIIITNIFGGINDVVSSWNNVLRNPVSVTIMI